VFRRSYTDVLHDANGCKRKEGTCAAGNTAAVVISDAIILAGRYVLSGSRDSGDGGLKTFSYVARGLFLNEVVKRYNNNSCYTKCVNYNVIAV